MMKETGSFYSSATTLVLGREPKDPVFKFIILFVLAAHLLGLFAFSWNASIKPPLNPRAKVLVKTITLNPRPQTLSAPRQPATTQASKVEPKPLPAPAIPKEAPKEQAIESKPEVKSAAPTKSEPVPKSEIASTKPAVITPAPPKPVKKEATPPAAKVEAKPMKQEAKKAPAPKPVSKVSKPATAPQKTAPTAPVKTVAKETPKPKAKPKEPEKTPAPPSPSPEEIAAQEAAKARQQELLAKAQENIAKIGKTRDKISAHQTTSDLAQATIPKSVGSLQIDALPVGEEVSLSAKEASYQDEVAYRLKVGLKLPDYGETKVKLTIEKSGSVSAVQIVSGQSKKNKEYIEKTLPTLIFSPFGTNFKNLSQYTFLITLNNDD